MTLLCTYQPAGRTCSGGPTPGAREAMAWFLGAYGARGGKNLGIYNCRPIAGTSTPSLHGEGRAGDFGVPLTTWAHALAQALVDHSAELGVQCVIYDGRIWSGSHCHEGWRPYEGSNKHTDHIHAEWTRDAAQTLTVARFNAVFAPATPVPAGWTEKLLKDLPTLALGDHSDDVARAQALLCAAHNTPANSIGAGGRPDGRFGPGTLAAVRALQSARKITENGRVGPRTWKSLLGR